MTLWLDWTISFQLFCTTPSLDLLFLGTIFSASDFINTEMFFKFKWLFNGQCNILSDFYFLGWTSVISTKTIWTTQTIPQRISCEFQGNVSFLSQILYILYFFLVKLCPNGHNNYQHCWANIVASTLAVVCKGMQQLPTMLYFGVCC